MQAAVPAATAEPHAELTEVNEPRLQPAAYARGNGAASSNSWPARMAGSRTLAQGARARGGPPARLGGDGRRRWPVRALEARSGQGQGPACLVPSKKRRCADEDRKRGPTFFCTAARAPRPLTAAHPGAVHCASVPLCVSQRRGRPLRQAGRAHATPRGFAVLVQVRRHRHATHACGPGHSAVPPGQVRLVESARCHGRCVCRTVDGL